jgi:hypothetical protein
MGGDPVNGPEHYKEAERYLRQVTTSRPVREDSSTLVTVVKEGAPPEVIALAQVHATLALAAATALAGVTLQLPETSDLVGGWNDAIGAERRWIP